MRLTRYWLLAAVFFSVLLEQNQVTGRLIESLGTKRLLGQTDSTEGSGTRQTIKEKLAELQRKAEELNEEIGNLQDELDGADVTKTSAYGDTSANKGTKSGSDYSDDNQRGSGESQDSGTGWSYSRGSSSYQSNSDDASDTGSASESRDTSSRSYSRSSDSTSASQGASRTYQSQSTGGTDSSSGYDSRTVDGEQQADTSGDAGEDEGTGGGASQHYSSYSHKTQSSSYATSSDGGSDESARGDGQSTRDTPEEDNYDGSSSVTYAQRDAASHRSSSYGSTSQGTGGGGSEEDYGTVGGNSDDTPPRHSSSSSVYSKGASTQSDGSSGDSTGSSWSKKSYNADGSEETDDASSGWDSGHDSSESYGDDGHRGGDSSEDASSDDDAADDASFGVPGSQGPQWYKYDKDMEADPASFEGRPLPVWSNYRTWSMLCLVGAVLVMGLLLSMYLWRKARAALQRSRQDTDIKADGVWDWRVHGEGRGEAHATVELLGKANEVKVEAPEAVWEKPIKKPLRALRKEK